MRSRIAEWAVVRAYRLGRRVERALIMRHLERTAQRQAVVGADA